MMRAGLYRPMHVKTIRSADAPDTLQAATVEGDRNRARHEVGEPREIWDQCMAKIS
jgi:hypothetical protein